MDRHRVRRNGQRGQMLVLFGLAATAIILGVGLVIDGGYGLAQRRASQNASDFAALAGARIIAEHIAGDDINGTDANVRLAITSTIQVNHGAPLVFGVPGSPVYVNEVGAVTGFVGGGTIPAGTAGVKVSSARSWRPFFLGLAGIDQWTAGADATAKGGYAAGGPGGDVFPAGIAEAFFDGRSPCSGPAGTTVGGGGVCDPQHLTPGGLNEPGAFGWLKFGATGKCTGFGLGMDPGDGCDSSRPFLQDEIGPPPNSYGCCSQVDPNDTPPRNRIGSLPGNKASADCSYYIDNKVVVTVPVWDYSGGEGTNAWYHIVGFTGFQITACDGGKDIEGVWRVPFWTGPTTSTVGFAGQALAVQLVR